MSYQRAPDLLIPEASVVLNATRRTILPRLGYAEGFTGLQQQLVYHLMSHIQFDVVDLLVAKMEDFTVDGAGARRRLPYAHLISHLLLRLGGEDSPHRAYYDRPKTSRLKEYRPAALKDSRRGRQALKELMERLTPAQRAASEVEDAALDEVEARLSDEVHWGDLSESDSEELEYLPPPQGAHDSKAGGSTQAAVPSPPHTETPVTVTETTVRQPAELTSVLATLAQNQQSHNELLLKMQQDQAQERAEQVR